MHICVVLYYLVNRPHIFKINQPFRRKHGTSYLLQAFLMIYYFYSAHAKVPECH